MDRKNLIRKRGRPALQQPSARLQIIDALAGLLGANPLSLPSLKAVSRAAGVTPALIHYHFSDLDGLLHCLYLERALPLLQPALQELRTGDDPASALTRFLSKWTTLLLRHRWLTPCLMQAPSGSADSLRRCTGPLRAAVTAAQRHGLLRDDLPAGYITLLLLSLGTLPHLARTTLAAGIEEPLTMDAQQAAALTLQHLAVLQAGIAPIPRVPAV